MKFVKGDLVSGKRWNGEHFIGVYEHEYDCGDHLITDGNKQFCVYKKDCHKANEQEKQLIEETILKPMREMEKANKKKKKQEENTKSNEFEEELTNEFETKEE